METPEEQLVWLSNMRGHATGLVTFIISANYNIWLSANKITKELATASNIKDKTNRKNVIEALKSISERLKGYNKSIPNGLAIYSGWCYNTWLNTNEQFVIEIFEPPYPIKHNSYYCDKVFHVDDVLRLYKKEEDYGLVMVSGEETNLYNYNGQRYSLINKFTIHRQKGHKKGGQSSHRFMMIHDEQINQYIKEICNMINESWYNGEEGRCVVKGIIIGGIGDIRNRIPKGEHLNDKIKGMIIGEVSMAEFNIEQLVSKAYNIINSDKVRKERIILEEVFQAISLGDMKYSYGLGEIEKLLTRGEVSELYVHEDSVRDNDIVLRLMECGKENGCTIHKISVGDEVGEMFRIGYGGIIAKLWYAMDDVHDVE